MNFKKYVSKFTRTVKSSSKKITTDTIIQDTKTDSALQKTNPLYSFHVTPNNVLESYDMAGATVFITDDFRYLVSEPQFPDVESTNAYEMIISYKQLRKYSNEITTIENLLKAAGIAASDLGLSDSFNRNHSTYEYYLNRDVLGYGILNVLLHDRAHLEDITCSDWRSVGVMHRNFLEHEIMRTNIRFLHREHMQTYLEDMASRGGKHISDSDPILDIQIDDVYRMAIICSDTLSPKSPCFSIRLKSQKPLTLHDMLSNDVVPYSVIAVIWKFLDAQGTGLTIGSTGAGKSSFLNSLFPLLPESSKIITIEDNAELQVPQFDWAQLIIDASKTSDDYSKRFEFLLDASLRHRPKMITIGEVRGESASKLFIAMSTGHSSLSSFHAHSPEVAKQRLVTEVKISEASLTHLWFLVTMGLIITRNRKLVRKCISFDEIYYDGKTANLINLCIYNPYTDKFEGDINSIISKSKKLKHTASLDASRTVHDDLMERIGFLQQLIPKKADTPKKVLTILSKYYDTKFS